MKAKEPHRVPLAAPVFVMLKTLKEQRRHESLVFPSPRGKVLSDMTLTALLRRVKAESDTPGGVATLHGFRSSLRDWCSENGYARDLAERALAHTIANQAEAAYHRSDLLEQRRPDDGAVVEARYVVVIAVQANYPSIELSPTWDWKPEKNDRGTRRARREACRGGYTHAVGALVGVTTAALICNRLD
jgi:hypothetical protein